MRKIILAMHVSLDGYVATPNKEFNWVHVDEDILNYTTKLTDQADTAIYGRLTYEMMDDYWPAAGDKPNATKHDRDHSKWYNNVEKYVISNSLKGNEPENARVIGDNLVEQINGLKNQPGKNILIFGSPGASHSLMKHNLIDEYWLFVNPILIGAGIPLFKNIEEKINLKLIESQVFSSGVIELHYGKK